MEWDIFYFEVQLSAELLGFLKRFGPNISAYFAQILGYL